METVRTVSSEVLLVMHLTATTARYSTLSQMPGGRAIGLAWLRTQGNATERRLFKAQEIHVQGLMFRPLRSISEAKMEKRYRLRPRSNMSIVRQCPLSWCRR